MIPECISRAHIEKAIRRIRREGGLKRRRSRGYCLVTTGGHLPPKYVIALAQEGGIGVRHKNRSREAQALGVRAVKKFETGIIRDPITITPDRTVADLLAVTQDNRISGVPVVEGDRHA